MQISRKKPPAPFRDLLSPRPNGWGFTIVYLPTRPPAKPFPLPPICMRIALPLSCGQKRDYTIKSTRERHLYFINTYVLRGCFPRPRKTFATYDRFAVRHKVRLFTAGRWKTRATDTRDDIESVWSAHDRETCSPHKGGRRKWEGEIVNNNSTIYRIRLGNGVHVILRNTTRQSVEIITPRCSLPRKRRASNAVQYWDPSMAHPNLPSTTTTLTT